MRKLIIAIFVVSIMFSSVSAYAAVDCTKDNPIDGVGDWFATLGKDGMEKQSILTSRKADRVAACTKREAAKAAKQAQKAGSDMKKKMGF